MLALRIRKRCGISFGFAFVAVFVLLPTGTHAEEISAEGHYLAIDDITVYYETSGEGEPLLLLHGGLGSIASFARQTPDLARHFRVIAPESRGHGRTSDSDRPITYELMATDMVALLDAMQLTSVYVVGWSDGGNIGLILAAKYPERVRKLVTIGANFEPAGIDDAGIDFISNWTVETAGEEMAEHYRSHNPDPDHWPIFFEKIRTMWLECSILDRQQLTTIQAPTLIVVADRDGVRFDHTQQMFETIPGAQLCVIPGATHFVPAEKPELLNPPIIAFLKEEVVQAEH